MEIKRILFPVDFSKFSKNSLNYSVFLADVHKAEIILLHVIDDHTVPNEWEQ